MSGTLRTGLPISLAVHSLIVAGFVFLFPAAPQETVSEEALPVEVLDEIVLEKQEAVAEDNIADPVAASVEVESTAPEVKTAARAEAEIAMDTSPKIEIAVNQPETEAISTEAALTLDMTPRIAIEADAPQPIAKPVEASLTLDMTPNIAIETEAPAAKTASVESQVTMDMTPNISMESVASDAAPSPLAKASVMMTIDSEVEMAAIDQLARTAPAAEASVSMSIAPPPAAKPQPTKKKAEKKTKKPRPRKVAEENFAARTGKPQKSAAGEKAAKIAAETKKSNTKKTAGKKVTTSWREQKLTGLGGEGKVAATNNKANASRYSAIVRARLAAAIRKGARANQGQLMVGFTVHPDGRMSNGRIVRSSGVPELDTLALAVLRRTNFPAFLPGMSRAPRSFNIPMNAK